MSDDLRTLIVDALVEVAPEIDPADVRDDEPVQEQFDLDSMDFLAFLEGVAARTGVEIPERAYRDVETIAGCVTYVAAARSA
ncbi:acyl carrier protein [Svornostia abyssi]|uniref:Acyl carrier protein n=1 Tax=Svornostia abyssi TaxID=2898438 RepID=A0ABY5PDD6_9ACTN|nr:acyl carrier protein [Parviterribacteraceae bacterium J379]